MPNRKEIRDIEVAFELDDDSPIEVTPYEDRIENIMRPQD